MPEANFCGTMYHRQDQGNDSSQQPRPLFHSPHSVLRFSGVPLVQARVYGKISDVTQMRLQIHSS